MAITNFAKTVEQAALKLPDQQSRLALIRAFEQVREELMRLEKEIEELKKGHSQR